MRVSRLETGAITRITQGAFQYCRSLAAVSLPVCSYVGSYAFQYCRSLTAVSLPACTTVGSFAFYNCISLTTVSLPACTTVGGYAFQDCSALATVSLPVCTSVSGSAFQRCYSLVSLYLTSVSRVPTLGLSVFSSTPIGGYSASAGQYGSVYVPASLYDQFLSATGWSSISARIVSVDSEP